MNASAADAPRERARTSRRATRPAPVGVDPHPLDHVLSARAGEDRPESWGDGTNARGANGAARGTNKGKPGAGNGVPDNSENDARLKQDKPPHWG